MYGIIFMFGLSLIDPVIQNIMNFTVMVLRNVYPAATGIEPTTTQFINKHTTIECGFTLKSVRDMTRTYSQMHRTDKYSQRSSMIWGVWLNG